GARMRRGADGARRRSTSRSPAPPRAGPRQWSRRCSDRDARRAAGSRSSYRGRISCVTSIRAAPHCSTRTSPWNLVPPLRSRFLDQQGIADYGLYLQDYGGPIGFRLALAHPERVRALIVQNAVAHEQGLSSLWASRKPFWAGRAAQEPAVRENLLSLEATRQRHVGRSPHPERIDPETWESEYALLTRPGMVDIHLELFHDYQTNVALYPKWQAYLRAVRPPTLVLWGKHDLSFTVAGALASGEEVAEAEVHLLDAGHFALDEATPQIAELIRSFLSRRAPEAWQRLREFQPRGATARNAFR